MSQNNRSAYDVMKEYLASKGRDLDELLAAIPVQPEDELPPEVPYEEEVPVDDILIDLTKPWPPADVVAAAQAKARAAARAAEAEEEEIDEAAVKRLSRSSRTVTLTFAEVKTIKDIF